MLFPVCKSVSKSCQLPVERPQRAEGQSSWEVSLLIIDDLLVNLMEALRKKCKNLDKLLFVIPLTHPHKS